MLKIGRKEGESVIVGDHIKVTVLEISGKTAKLGFEFPDDISVHRQEVYERIQQENRMAAESMQYLSQLQNKLEEE